jgi:transcriptional regulator with XRE-family HTH domain
MNRIQLGLKLKDARQQGQLTQEQLAERIKSDPKKISRIERGVQFPEEDYLRVLCSMSDLDFDNVQHSILEIKSVENASTWEVNPATVSNEDLLKEIRGLRSSLDSISSKLDILWDERRKKSTTV